MIVRPDDPGDLPALVPAAHEMPGDVGDPAGWWWVPDGGTSVLLLAPA